MILPYHLTKYHATMLLCHHATILPYHHANMQHNVKVITLTSIVFELMTMLEMSSLLLGNKTRRGNPSIIHLNYNILPTKTTSSSAHDVRGMAGSFTVTTPRKEVGKTSRVFTQVSLKQIGGCCAFTQV